MTLAWSCVVAAVPFQRGELAWAHLGAQTQEPAQVSPLRVENSTEIIREPVSQLAGEQAFLQNWWQPGSRSIIVQQGRTALMQAVPVGWFTFERIVLRHRCRRRRRRW